MRKTLFIITGIIVVLFIAGCDNTINNNTINTTDMTNSVNIEKSGETNTLNNSSIQMQNSATYNFCLENNGSIINGYPTQCIYNSIIYFQNTENAMNIQFCKSYFDGCNTCIVDNGTIGGCTKMMCSSESSKTPRCMTYNETIPEWRPLQITANFTCDQDNITVLFDNVAHTATMTINGEDTLLAQIITGSGAAYSNQKITFFNHGNEATVYDATNSSNNVLTNCISQ